MLSTRKYSLIILCVLTFGLISCSQEKQTPHWSLEPPLIVKNSEDPRGVKTKFLITKGLSQLSSSDQLVFSNNSGGQTRVLSQCYRDPINLFVDRMVPTQRRYRLLQLLPQRALQLLLKEESVSCSFTFIISKTDVSHRFAFGPVKITYANEAKDTKIFYRNREASLKQVSELEFSNFRFLKYNSGVVGGSSQLVCEHAVLKYRGPQQHAKNLESFLLDSATHIQPLASQKCFLATYKNSFLQAYTQAIRLHFEVPHLIYKHGKSPQPDWQSVIQKKHLITNRVLTNTFHLPLKIRVQKIYPVEYISEYNSEIFSQPQSAHLKINLPVSYKTTETQDHIYYDIPPHHEVPLHIILSPTRVCHLRPRNGSHLKGQKVIPRSFSVLEEKGGIELLEQDMTPTGLFIPSVDDFSVEERRHLSYESKGQNCL